MKAKPRAMHDEVRDESLGRLLKRAAESLASSGDPDFSAVYARVGEGPKRPAIRFHRRLTLPFAAAAAAALAFGLVLQHGSSPAYGGNGRQYSQEIALFAHRLVGYHSLPLFTGAATAGGVAPAGGSFAEERRVALVGNLVPSGNLAPSANSATGSSGRNSPPTGELSNFVNELWNHEGI